MGCEFAKSLLLKAINTDGHRPDSFTKLVFTDNPVVDLEAMKLQLFKDSALYDGKDRFLNDGTSKKNAISINLAEVYPDASSEALNDIDTYAINRTATNPEARMPDELFQVMEPRDRSDWTKIPEALRMKLVKFLTGTKKRHDSSAALAQTRRVYVLR